MAAEGAGCQRAIALRNVDGPAGGVKVAFSTPRRAVTVYTIWAIASDLVGRLVAPNDSPSSTRTSPASTAETDNPESVPHRGG